LLLSPTGAVNISYETVQGSFQDLRQGALAQPGQDFRYVSSSVIMQDGQTSVSIPITIIDVWCCWFNNSPFHTYRFTAKLLVNCCLLILC